MLLKKLSSEQLAISKSSFIYLLFFALIIPAALKVILGGSSNIISYYAESYDSTLGIIAYQAINVILSICESVLLCLCACLLGFTIVKVGASKSVKHIIVCILTPIVGSAFASLTIYVLIICNLHDMTLSTFKQNYIYYIFSSLFNGFLNLAILAAGIIVFTSSRKSISSGNTKRPIVILASICTAISLCSYGADIIDAFKNSFATFNLNFVLGYIVIPLFSSAVVFYFSCKIAKIILSRVGK